MATMMKGTLVVLMAVLLVACSSTFPKVDPSKRYVRYFDDTKDMAYSLFAPEGPWVYIAGKYKRDNTSKITFLSNAGPYVGIEVSFRMSELFLKFNDDGLIEQNKFFFKHGTRSNNDSIDEAFAVGSQGFYCAKGPIFSRQHYGPSRDPAISGKWAGGGNTKYNRQIQCPFHRDGRHFLIVVDMTYTVLDAAEPAGVSVDIQALHARTERQFERVWQSLHFNPALSQAPLPDEPPAPPRPVKPRHVFPDQYESGQPLPSYFGTPHRP